MIRSVSISSVFSFFWTFSKPFSLSLRPEIPSSLQQISGHRHWSKTCVLIILSSLGVVTDLISNLQASGARNHRSQRHFQEGTDQATGHQINKIKSSWAHAFWTDAHRTLKHFFANRARGNERTIHLVSQHAHLKNLSCFYPGITLFCGWFSRWFKIVFKKPSLPLQLQAPKCTKVSCQFTFCL